TRGAALRTHSLGDDARETLSGEANDQITNLMDIDRTPELLTWVFGGLFGRKQCADVFIPSRNIAAVATVGGGCFWCLEALYQELQGVVSVTSGYAGGTLADPTYKQVLTGKTGHAEVVQVEFDVSVLSYRDVLQIFMSSHDPTTRNRQGNDRGPQYRSIILTHDEQQRAEAEQVLEEANRDRWFGWKVCTELAPLQAFYRAEAVHQRYYARNPSVAYCAYVVTPKLLEFRRKYAAKLKLQPAADD
ncbi:Peptide methionine sulfoxide reductase MsrA, partial [Tetrabaena socialis]